MKRNPSLSLDSIVRENKRKKLELMSERYFALPEALK